MLTGAPLCPPPACGRGSGVGVPLQGGAYFHRRAHPPTPSRTREGEW
jgi:hypothetical protein